MFGECHAHIALDGVKYQTSAARHKRGVDKARVRAHLAAYQARSVSFIRDGGDSWGASLYAKRIAAEYGIDFRTPAFGMHKQGHYGSIVGRSFNTLKEYAALVDEAAEKGADFIKVMTTGILDFDNHGVIRGEPLSKQEVSQMVHIAHEQGFAVMAHTNGARSIIEALECGVDSIEHGNLIDDEGIAALAQSGAVFVPTATVARNWIGTGAGNDSALKRIVADSLAAIAQAQAKGALLALGSDAGAAGVLHGTGVEEEYVCFKQAIPSQETLIQTLKAGEATIQARFRRT